MGVSTYVSHPTLAIITDANGKDVRACSDYTLDLAFGDDENSGEFTDNMQKDIDAGATIYIDGTDYGMVVDGYEIDTETGIVTVMGRTWQGILAQKIIEPPSGSAYRTVSGEANAVIGQIVTLLDLQDVFNASTEDSGITISSYQFNRYTDAYTGLRTMLRTKNAKLTMRRRNGVVEIAAVPIVTYSNSITSNVMSFIADKWNRKTNHLIALGQGDLQNRYVYHLYADANGKISTTQTLYGVDEIAEIYDAGNQEDSELRTSAMDKMKELQNIDTIDVQVDDGTMDIDVDDIVTGLDTKSHIEVTASISKKIIKNNGGVLTASYNAGNIKVSASRS